MLPFSAAECQAEGADDPGPNDPLETLVTPPVLDKLGLTELKQKTFISEDQYEKGKKLLEESSGDYYEFINIEV